LLRNPHVTGEAMARCKALSYNESVPSIDGACARNPIEASAAERNECL
jgi:hypothetical protein